MDSPVPAQAESERDRLAEAVAHSDETQRAVDEEARRAARIFDALSVGAALCLWRVGLVDFVCGC
jgi:hypothetical protein